LKAQNGKITRFKLTFATGCSNLLLLTDHESGTIEEHGSLIKVQPVYEWSLELGM